MTDPARTSSGAEQCGVSATLRCCFAVCSVEMQRLTRITKIHHTRLGETSSSFFSAHSQKNQPKNPQFQCHVESVVLWKQLIGFHIADRTLIITSEPRCGQR